jgi:hypothetical protein
MIIYKFQGDKCVRKCLEMKGANPDTDCVKPDADYNTPKKHVYTVEELKTNIFDSDANRVASLKRMGGWTANLKRLDAASLQRSRKLVGNVARLRHFMCKLFDG